MNTSLAEAIELVDALPRGVEVVDVVVCPPFPWLVTLAGRGVDLGAQDLFWEEKGAFTGEVSPAMIAPYCRYAIVGHSERRQHFGESDETVNRKLRAALRHGLVPIVCVGETLAENESGRTLEVLRCQLGEGLRDIPVAELVIAYEPVWAIGTGRPATAAGANDTIGEIRRIVGEPSVRIQYGGSVTAANAAELFAQPEIDGALVGGASLKAADFGAIIRASAEARL